MSPAPHDDLRAHRDWLLSFVGLPKGGTAVDLGCGNGDDLLMLAARHHDPSARFLGIDASAEAIAVATARAAHDPRVSFVRHRLGGQVPLDDARVQDFGRLVKRGLASEADYRRVVADLEERSREGRYFYSITGYVYVGLRRAPAAQPADAGDEPAP